MTLEERAVLAAENDALRNELISEYRNFILSQASKTLKRSVTDSDDEFMTAMIAFNEAIDGYNADKGRFLSFASMIIRSRLIDGIRRESRHNDVLFSSMASEDDDGDVIMSVVSGIKTPKIKDKKPTDNVNLVIGEADKEELKEAKEMGVSVAKAKTIEEYTTAFGGTVSSNAYKLGGMTVSRSADRENDYNISELPLWGGSFFEKTACKNSEVKL